MTNLVTLYLVTLVMHAFTISEAKINSNRKQLPISLCTRHVAFIVNGDDCRATYRNMFKYTVMSSRKDGKNVSKRDSHLLNVARVVPCRGIDYDFVKQNISKSR